MRYDICYYLSFCRSNFKPYRTYVVKLFIFDNKYTILTYSVSMLFHSNLFYSILFCSSPILFLFYVLFFFIIFIYISVSIFCSELFYSISKITPEMFILSDKPILAPEYHVMLTTATKRCILPTCVDMSIIVINKPQKYYVAFLSLSL